MKEIIEKIVKIEDQAKKKTELSRQQAGEMILEAQNKAHKIIEDAKQKALTEKEELLRRVEVNSLEKKSKTIEDASKNAESLLREKSPLAKGIADRIFNKIIKTEI